MKAVFQGVDGPDALFVVRNLPVVINTRTLVASVLTATPRIDDVLHDRSWISPHPADPVSTWAEVAECAIEDANELPGVVLASIDTVRSYTIPQAVAKEARSARARRWYEGARFTSVGLAVSKTLAASGQITLPEIHHLNRYYTAHTDGKTTNPIGWGLWGGDAGRNWVEGVLAKTGIVADADAGINLMAFYNGEDDERSFYCEPSQEEDQDEMSPGAAVSLFRMNDDGSWLVWMNGDWEPVDQQNVPQQLVELDDDTAVYVGSALYDAPEQPVSLRDYDPEEWDLHAESVGDLDHEMLDRVMQPGALQAAGAASGRDGNYTPQERSQNVAHQPRDKNGRFASVGDSGVMKSGQSAKIVTVNPVDNSLIVRTQDGTTYAIPAKDFEIDGQPTASTPTNPDAPVTVPALNLDKILAQPRAIATTPKALLKHELPPMNAAALKSVLDNYGKFITQERRRNASKFKGGTGFREHRPQSQDVGLPKWSSDPKALRRDIRRQEEIATGHKRHRTASAEPTPGEQEFEDIPSEVTPNDGKLTPETSDVKPLYLAIVDHDDPRAVTDLIAMIPASSQTDETTTYRRVAGEWVEDTKILSDMRSPTPPPVVQLDDSMYKDVLAQVDRAGVESQKDEEILKQTKDTPEAPTAPVAAAGGLDRNRGDAEKLRRYWAHGEGAAKIRWGTPGDFDRCVRHLEKHMPGRAKGYCNLRHKEATGEYPPTHAKHEREHAVDEFDWEPPTYIIESLQNLAALDEDEFSIVAAGGLDRNRGGAEKLREYWLHGKGALKIRWGTPGDWTRCHRHLAKYLGPRSKGYCALRHREATGMWPGDKRNRQGIGASGTYLWYSTDFLRTTQGVIRASAEVARAEVARRRIRGEANVLPANVEEIEGERRGKGFRIPLVIPENIESGDGRTFESGSLSHRNLPLPLLWQMQTGEGHNGSVLAGRIDRLERTPEGLGNAYGVFDTGPHGRELQRLVSEGMLRWVSGDMDNFKAKKIEPEQLAEGKEPDETNIESDKLNVRNGRLMAVTVVPKPAYQNCRIEMFSAEEDEPVIQDGVYTGEAPPLEVASIVAAGATAFKVPTIPPKEWFDNPRLKGVTPLSVDDNGRVFGHVASWTIDHIGLPRGTRAPRSSSNYAYFHTGVVRADDGTDAHVGQLTLAGGHADLTADAALAVKHYDDTGSAIADVHAGEDAYGIWVSGALRPGVTPEQIRTLRASAPSGDWRVINNRLELVAVCQVNVPGFPITRALAASGQIYSLIAAGTATLVKMKTDPMNELQQRITSLEAAENARDMTRVASARERMQPTIEKRDQERKQMENLAADARARVFNVMGIDGYLVEFKDFSSDKRKKLAKDKKALPDGSFPIENKADLRRAVMAYGRASEDKKARVRRHIIRRARALDKSDMIPDSWSEASLNDLALYRRDARETLTAAAKARDERELKARVASASKRMKG